MFVLLPVPGRVWGSEPVLTPVSSCCFRWRIGSKSGGTSHFPLWTAPSTGKKVSDDSSWLFQHLALFQSFWAGYFQIHPARVPAPERQWALLDVKDRLSVFTAFLGLVRVTSGLRVNKHELQAQSGFCWRGAEMEGVAWRFKITRNVTLDFVDLLSWGETQDSTSYCQK